MSDAAKSSNSSPALLRAKSLIKGFVMGDTDVHVLKNVDLAVKDGEFLAIEGRSGSGKSTLLHILGALDSVEHGTIEFAEQDYTRYTGAGSNAFTNALSSRYMIWGMWGLVGAAIAVFVVGFLTSQPRVMYASGGLGAALVVLLLLFFGTRFALFIYNFGREQLAARLRNKSFGFVFQFYHLLPELNVLENTMLGSMIEFSWFRFGASRRRIAERAHRILDELGLSHRLKHKPAQLSGGERQRVAIARALMNEPRILFADEPTGNLDSETGKQIMAVLEKLHREGGQTIVMVTHDRSIARMADRVLILRDGRLERPADAPAKAAVGVLDYQ